MNFYAGWFSRRPRLSTRLQTGAAPNGCNRPIASSPKRHCRCAWSTWRRRRVSSRLHRELERQYARGPAHAFHPGTSMPRWSSSSTSSSPSGSGAPAARPRPPGIAPLRGRSEFPGSGLWASTRPTRTERARACRTRPNEQCLARIRVQARPSLRRSPSAPQGAPVVAVEAVAEVPRSRGARGISAVMPLATGSHPYSVLATGNAASPRNRLGFSRAIVLKSSSPSTARRRTERRRSSSSAFSTT